MTTKASSWGRVVPILSSSKKPRNSWIPILALFGSKLESLADSRAIDITLEGYELVLPRAAKMTSIIPKGGLQQASGDPNLFVPPGHWNGATTASTFLFKPAGPNGPTNSYLLCIMSLVLMVLAIKALVALHGVSNHLVRLFKE